MGVMEDVQGLQATIVSRTESIFSQLSTIASNASSKALGIDIPSGVDSVTIPTDLEISVGSGTDFVDDEYTHAFYTTFLNRILSDITSGDYGLDAGDEARLFESARERELELIASASDDATRLFSSGGFTYPTGAAQAARARVLKEGRDKVSSLNRDLLSKKADLYLQAKTQAHQTGTQLEQMNRTTFDARMQRRVQVAIQDLQGLVEAAIGEGNIKIAAVKAAVELALGKATMALEAAKAEAATIASIATAGMSGLHANATLGANANASEEFQGSVSNDNDVLTQHNYSH